MLGGVAGGGCVLDYGGGGCGGVRHGGSEEERVEHVEGGEWVADFFFEWGKCRWWWDDGEGWKWRR